MATGTTAFSNNFTLKRGESLHLNGNLLSDECCLYMMSAEQLAVLSPFSIFVK